MKNTTAIIIITESLTEKDILGWKNTFDSFKSLHGTNEKPAG